MLAQSPLNSLKFILGYILLDAVALVLIIIWCFGLFTNVADIIGTSAGFFNSGYFISTDLLYIAQNLIYVLVPLAPLVFSMKRQIGLARSINQKKSDYTIKNTSAYKATIILPVIMAVLLILGLFAGAAMNDTRAPIGEFASTFATGALVIAIFISVAFIQYRFISRSKKLKAICTK